MMNRKTSQPRKRAARLLARSVSEGSAANDLGLNTTGTSMNAPPPHRPITDYRLLIARNHPS